MQRTRRQCRADGLCPTDAGAGLCRAFAVAGGGKRSHGKSFRLQGQAALDHRAGDQHAVHFGGAVVDAGDTGIAVDALQRQFFGKAVASMYGQRGLFPIGKRGDKVIFCDMNNILYENSMSLGPIHRVIGINSVPPTDVAIVRVFGNNIPVGIMLAQYLGFKALVDVFSPVLATHFIAINFSGFYRIYTFGLGFFNQLTHVLVKVKLQCLSIKLVYF